MIEFVTVLLVFSVLVWPVSYMVALIFKLFKVKKMAKEMYPGVCIDNNANQDENEVCAEADRYDMPGENSV